MQILLSCFVYFIIFYVSILYLLEDLSNFCSPKILFHNQPMEGFDHCQCGHFLFGHPLAIRLLNGKKERKHVVNVEAKKVGLKNEKLQYMQWHR